MISRPYRFTVSGHGDGGATFLCSGTVIALFPDVFNAVMKDSFAQLTEGRARYGTPGGSRFGGVGCRGPYEIASVFIELVPQ